MLARDRIASVLDASSPFLEIGRFAADGVYDEDIPCAGVVAGIGWVSGRECVIVANDATVKGGTYFPLTVKKHLRAQTIAEQNHFTLYLSCGFQVVPTCLVRMKYFQIKTILAVYSLIRLIYQPKASPRLPLLWDRVLLAVPTVPAMADERYYLFKIRVQFFWLDHP